MKIGISAAALALFAAGVGASVRNTRVPTPPRPPPEPTMTAPPEPPYTCGSRTGFVTVADFSGSCKEAVRAQAIRDATENTIRHAHSMNNAAAVVHGFAGGGAQSVVRTGIVTLDCAPPPVPPTQPPACDRARYSKTSWSGSLDDVLDSGDGYRACHEKQERYTAALGTYRAEVTRLSSVMEERRQSFTTTFRREVASVAAFFEQSAINRARTHLLSAFVSIRSACDRLRREGAIGEHDRCVATMYSDFDPDPKPRDFLARLAGIDLHGIEVQAFVIRHTTVKDETDTKLAEVRRWLGLMGATVYVEPYEYDPSE